MTIILGIIGLLFLVLIHELGHYVMARLNNIKVEVFSIGMGPMLIKKEFKGTLWAISLLPIGGYCKLAGENYPSSNDEIKEGSLYYGKVRRRFLTVLGGPLFSIFFAYFCFIITANLNTTILPIKPIIIASSEESEPFATGDEVIAINKMKINYASELEWKIKTSGKETLKFTILRNGEELVVNKDVDLLSNGEGYLPIEIWQDAIIGGFISDSVVKDILQAGDKILEINNIVVNNSKECRLLVEQSLGKEVLITYKRGSEIFKTSVTPLYSKDRKMYYLGIYFALPKPITVPAPPFNKAFVKGSKDFVNSTYLYFKSIKNLFKGAKLYKAMSGPVQTTYLIGSVAKEGLNNKLPMLIGFFGFISLILGIMNLLPIPLLDGGHLLLFTIEKIRGKFLSPASFKIYQNVGIVFLLFLMALALFSDAMSFTRI